jgi:hypothetical protein
VTPRNRNRLIVIIVLAVPVAIFVWSIFLNAFKVPPAPPLPNPNGYDDLVKAGELLAPNFLAYTNLDEAGLETLVSEDSNALVLARAGLQKQCHTSLDYLIGTTNWDWLNNLKYLGGAFAAEGRLAEIQGYTNEAVKSYLDVIHLANESSRGGVMIDELVGIAIEARGTSELQRLVPQLDSQTCSNTATALETLDSQRQTWDEVMQQEHDWARRNFPGIKHEIQRMMERSSVEKISRAAEARFNKQETKTRQLIIDLAARVYLLDKGHSPASVTDLVPDYLKTIPQDPLTGTNMTYLPQ